MGYQPISPLDVMACPIAENLVDIGARNVRQALRRENIF